MILRKFQWPALAFLLATAPLLAGAAVCELKEAEDAALQRQLTRVLEVHNLGPAARRGDLAVSLLVLTDPDRPRLAQINGHEMLYAASLPKIAILLGAAVDLEQGRLQLTPALERDIHDMIRYSCNDCSNRVLERVGREHLLDILQSPHFAFYDPERGGGLWMGKDYGPTPAYHRDPLAGLSHGATAFQVARFYCGLQRGGLVGPEQTRLMREAMVEPGIHHKFVKGLSGHDELTLYRKSGTWRDFHADSALVESDDAVYVIVALARNPRGYLWLERLAEPLHRLATRKRAATVVSKSTAPAGASMPPAARGTGPAP